VFSFVHLVAILPLYRALIEMVDPAVASRRFLSLPLILLLSEMTGFISSAAAWSARCASIEGNHHDSREAKSMFAG